jgi:hypothetical protein
MGIGVFGNRSDDHILGDRVLEVENEFGEFTGKRGVCIGVEEFASTNRAE